MKHVARRAPLALALMGLLFGCESVSAGTASVVLSEAAMTSAGVFDADGRLVRTLWSGRKQPAGRLQISWDGRDDDGASMPESAHYVARVLAHNVRYVWEGVIGNTSRDAEGTHIHRAFGPVNDMAIDSEGDAFYVVGYNEQQHAIHRFRTTDPSHQTSLAHDDYLRTFRYAATDGTLAYFANAGGQVEPETFVVALKVGDGTEYRFPSGSIVMPGRNWGNRWESVIDHDRERGSAPSGLAVQQHGDMLFVAHRNSNEVRLFDKRSGESRGRIPVTAPGDLEAAPDDSVWVLCRVDGKPAVVRYRLRGSDWRVTDEATAGLVDPVAIGVSPVDGTLVVADAATEQLKAFDASGIPKWILGQADGYRRGGPDVAADRFWLSKGPTYVSFAADGSFWVGDTGNDRNLHFSAQRQYLDHIMYLPASYVATVDPADPSRVFRHFMEFSVDYSKPVRDSWKFVRNWAAGLDQRYFGEFDGFESVYTLGNHRTYGVVRLPGTKVREIVELTNAGIRPTGAHLNAGEKLYPDGSRRSHLLRLNSLQVYKRPLDGFDESANPQWTAFVLLGGVAPLTGLDPYYHEVPEVPPVNGATYPETVDGSIISFSPGKSRGFHLGGIKPGREKWQWRASPSGSWATDKNGAIASATADGRYELANGVNYSGSIVMAAGRQIVFGYHGEAWNGGQANQWLHFLDNGLFVGQFGRPVYPASNRNEALPGAAGNAFSPSLIAVNGTTYLWHNDESVHGGMHRWRIEGTDGIRTFDSPIVP